MLLTPQWFVRYLIRIFLSFGPDTTTIWSLDLEWYNKDLQVVDWQKVGKMSTQKLINWFGTVIVQPGTDTSKISNDDYRYLQRTANKKNSELKRDVGQIHTDPEQTHGPGLEPDTIPQPEAETETRRDPDEEKKQRMRRKMKTRQRNNSTDASTKKLWKPSHKIRQAQQFRNSCISTP